MRAVGRDVTERRGKEVDLRARKRILSRAARLTGVGGWELDLRSGPALWSKHTRRIHEMDNGVSPTTAEAMGFFSPEGQAAVRSAAEEVRRAGQAWQVELPLTTAKGRRAWVRVIAETEVRDDGPARLTGATLDITSEKASAERLGESERFARVATDAVPTRSTGHLS